MGLLPKCCRVAPLGSKNRDLTIIKIYDNDKCKIELRYSRRNILSTSSAGTYIIEILGFELGLGRDAATVLEFGIGDAGELIIIKKTVETPQTAKTGCI